MYKIKDEISNVKYFDIGKYLCYESENGIVCSNGFEFDRKSNGTICINGSKLFRQSFRGVLEIFDIDSKQKIYDNLNEEFKLFINDDFIINGESIYVNCVKNKTEVSGILNFYSGDFNELDFILGRVLLDFKISFNWNDKTNSIIVNSTSDGRLLWSCKNIRKFFDNYGNEINDEFRNVIGIYNNNIWIAFSSGMLMAFNISSGQLEHEIAFNESNFGIFSYEIKKDEYLPYGEFMQLDSERGEIIGLRNDYFMRIDLKQPVLKREYISVSQSMKNHKMSSSYRNYEFPMDDKFIYFCDDRAGKIGIFDRQLLEVIWSYELDMEHEGVTQILDMKHADNRWYVLDRNNTLHVFEKNDDETD